MNGGTIIGLYLGLEDDLTETERGERGLDNG